MFFIIVFLFCYLFCSLALSSVCTQDTALHLSVEHVRAHKSDEVCFASYFAFSLDMTMLK